MKQIVQELRNIQRKNSWTIGPELRKQLGRKRTNQEKKSDKDENTSYTIEKPDFY